MANPTGTKSATASPVVNEYQIDQDEKATNEATFGNDTVHKVDGNVITGANKPKGENTDDSEIGPEVSNKHGVHNSSDGSSSTENLNNTKRSSADTDDNPKRPSKSARQGSNTTALANNEPTLWELPEGCYWDHTIRGIHVATNLGSNFALPEGAQFNPSIVGIHVSVQDFGAQTLSAMGNAIAIGEKLKESLKRTYIRNMTDEQEGLQRTIQRHQWRAVGRKRWGMRGVRGSTQLAGAKSRTRLIQTLRRLAVIDPEVSGREADPIGSGGNESAR